MDGKLELIEKDEPESNVDEPNDTFGELSASEAIFAFCGWLTTRKEETMMGSSHDCGVIAELVGRFADLNGLQEPRPDWQKHFEMPVDTPFGRARDLMWDTFQKDTELKSAYEANVACILMDNIPGLKRGQKAYDLRNSVATLIMDRIFSG